MDGDKVLGFYGGPAVALDYVVATDWFFVLVVEEVAVCFYAGEGDCEAGFVWADEDGYLGSVVTGGG